MTTNDIEIDDIGPNLKVIQSPRSEDVRSLQDLVDSCDIDLKVWEPLQPKFNKWPTTMKDANGDPMTVFNYQVKCSFIRRNPIIVEPLIRPLKVSATYPTFKVTRKPNKSGLKTALILPDPQFGFSRDLDTGRLDTFHDMRALDVAVLISCLRARFAMLPDYCHSPVPKPACRRLITAYCSAKTPHPKEHATVPHGCGASIRVGPPPVPARSYSVRSLWQRDMNCDSISRGSLK